MKTSFNEKQIEPLTKLGLSRPQAVLYLTSLKHGVLSVLELSRLTGVSRQQIYEDALQLAASGLYEVTGRDRKKYIPAHPSRLVKLARTQIQTREEILSHVTDMLPQFESLAIPKKNKVLIKYYEGHDKVREALDAQLEALKDTECVSFAGNLDEVYEFFPESYWDKWDKQFVKQGSFIRMLAHKTDAGRRTAENDKLYRRETRWIENFPLQMNIEVFNNVVLIISFRDELAIWIESAILAQSYRIMFNLLWERAKRFE